MRWHVSRLPTPLVDRLLNLKASGSGNLFNLHCKHLPSSFSPELIYVRGKGGREVAKSHVSQAHVWGEVSFG